MAITGESSSTVAVPNNDKPVVVRVKRKITQSRLDAFWLEINERPLKRPLLDFEKLSISDSAGKDELKAKKVFVQHVETLNTAEATIDIVQSFMLTSADALDGKTKSEERRRAFKKENRHDQHTSKARQKQEELAKNARFEQIWRSRKGNNEEMHGKEIREMCHFYDVVRVDAEGRSNEGQKQEDLSSEDQSLLSSYLPLLREFLPSHAAEIESEIRAKMSEKDDYVYDYYTVNDDMKVDDDDGSIPFLLVQVDDEDYYDGPDESEYDSEDSNAENNPRNDYPEEMSGEEEEEEEEEDEEEEEEERAESKASGESEDSSEDRGINGFSDPDLLHDDDLYYDDFNDNGDYFDYNDDDDDDDEDDDDGGDGKDWRWSYR